MKLLELIKFEKEPYFHTYRTDPTEYLKTILKTAREQRLLPIICSKLGVSLRSVQRWLPTPYKKRKELHEPTQLPLPIFPVEKTYKIKKKKRIGRKKKAQPISKSCEMLLECVFMHDLPVPDREPTNKEIMNKLLNFKESVRTWKKVSEQLRVDEMTLYRFRKTGKLKKSLRILLHILLSRLETD